MPADDAGNTYIMVAIDGFSRFVALEPATDASGESVARFGGSQYDSYLIDAFCHLLGLIGMLLWPIGRRQAAWLSESTRKSVGIFGSSAWIDGSGISGAACYLLFSGLSTHSYINQLESSLVDFKLWTVFSYLIPFLVQCSRVLQPSQQKDRRLVVGEYLKHLVDTQLEAVIVKCAPNAEEYHHKYLKSRVRKVATSSTQHYKAGDWVLAQWQGLPQGRTRPTKLSPCWRGPFSIFVHSRRVRLNRLPVGIRLIR